MSLSTIESLHFVGLVPKLESEEFKGMEIQDPSNNLPPVLIEPLHGEAESKLFRVYQHKVKSGQVVDALGVAKILSECFSKGYQLAICKTDREQTIYSRTPKGVRINSEPLSKIEKGLPRLDVKELIETPRIRDLFLELGVLTKDGAIRREQYNKVIQIKNFLLVVREMLPQFRDKKHLTIVDAACGKSYLSFILYHFLREEWGLDARFLCIDTNSKLIARCEQIQETFSYKQMRFFVSTVSEFKAEPNIDLLYSLHGCDTATDEAIATGVRLNSRSIMVVPCCHFELREQLRSHPLKGMTKFGLFEERFAALLTDSLRALALEGVGYDVSTFRFVTDDISPKNTLIRALKGHAPKPQSLQQYAELKNMFGVNPTIENLLPLELTGAD